MEELTLEDLRAYLRDVRGETRVKAKEENIRNDFLQKAAEEIYREHDWPFTEEDATLEYDEDDSRWYAPADMSFKNGFTITDGTTRYGKLKAPFRMDKETGRFYFTSLTSEAPSITYHIEAPNLVNDSQATLFFPDGMLIAERAYVRLKTAYFPDETSKEELAMSKRNLRELYKKMVPKQNFTHWSWGVGNGTTSN